MSKWLLQPGRKPLHLYNFKVIEVEGIKLDELWNTLDELLQVHEYVIVTLTDEKGADVFPGSYFKMKSRFKTAKGAMSYHRLAGAIKRYFKEDYTSKFKNPYPSQNKKEEL